MQTHNTTAEPSNVSFLNRHGPSVAAQIAKLKAFAPITSIVCDLNLSLSHSEAKSIGTRLMAKVELETTAVFNSICCDPSKEWVQGQIAPVVADLLASLYRSSGEACFDVDIASAVTPSLLTNIETSVPSLWRDTGSRVLVVDSMLNAISCFRGAFEKNSLGFSDVEDASDWAKGVIFEGAQHAVSIVQSEVACGTGGDPVILLRSLIKQSGYALADAWRGHKHIGDPGVPGPSHDQILTDVKANHIERLDAAIDRICMINDDLDSALSGGF